MFESLRKGLKLRGQILTYLISAPMNDIERAKFLGLPEGCKMREGAKIVCPEIFKCGKYVWIGEGVMLDASGRLEIGDYCQLSAYACIYTHSTYKQALRSETGINRQAIVRRPTIIEHNSYIGSHAVVYSGVRIGPFSVIMPMSVVTHDIPGYCIAGGIPAMKVRDLENKDFEVT